MTKSARHPRFAVIDEINKHGSVIGDMATQQNAIITDPTHAAGDPTRNYAVVCIGNLRQVGINAFGIASFKTGTWVQL